MLASVTALPQVHLLAGLNGAGKTTHARHLESALPAVRFTLDEWMLRLHHLTFNDSTYPAAASDCRDLIWDTAIQVLHAGVPVVLDWNLWSRAHRAEWVERAARVGLTCTLHYLDTPLDAATRRATGRIDPDAHRLSADDVRHLAGLFEPPTTSEGFVLEVAGHRDW